jgi:peptidoglycan hydrolase CwlO-like protein
MTKEEEQQIKAALDRLEKSLDEVMEEIKHPQTRQDKVKNNPSRLGKHGK